MGNINREDMLELTRRMTVKRNCFSRIAGAYFDEDGMIEGTFNTHFLKLSPKDQKLNLDIAKAIPFAKTNSNLREFEFSDQEMKPGSIWQILMALKNCELKNDGLLEVFYELVGEKYISSKSYAVYFFYGTYDIPLKGTDKESLGESEEVYQFLLCTICPYHGDYELEEPEAGFLFPAFTNRSSNIEGIEIFHKGEDQFISELEGILFTRI